LLLPRHCGQRLENFSGERDAESTVICVVGWVFVAHSFFTCGEMDGGAVVRGEKVALEKWQEKKCPTQIRRLGGRKYHFLEQFFKADRMVKVSGVYLIAGGNCAQKSGILGQNSIFGSK